MLPPRTSWTNPRSRPRPRSAPVRPHIPGFRRPQLRHSRSATPTSLPHDGQTTDPVLWRWNMAGTLAGGPISARGPVRPLDERLGLSYGRSGETFGRVLEGRV